jgi:hypothetical protein
LASAPPHGPFLFSLFWRQDLIDLLAGELTNLPGFRARFSLREGRIRSQIIKLFIPVPEDGPDFRHLLVRQAQSFAHPLELSLHPTARRVRLLRSWRRLASLLPSEHALPDSEQPA